MTGRRGLRTVKNQTIILLIIAGGCGLVAMMGVKQYLASQNKVEETPKVQVLVASATIKQGDPLTELNTQFVSVDAETCPAGVVTELEQIAERSLKVPRNTGDWIMVDQLTEKGQVGKSAVIPPGMRISTIPVDPTTHHSGMLQAGNRIDLFLTYRDRDEDTGRQTEKIMPILEYIEVFAVDNQVYGINNGGENIQARNISLLVTPEQMMRLQLAKKKGEITTSLRSSEDMDSVTIAEMTEADLSSTTSNRNDGASTLDVREIYQDEPEEGGFKLPEEPGMHALLQESMNNGQPGGTGPIAMVDDLDDPSQYWTMAIHEAGGVRVEKVNLLSDAPIDRSGRSTKSAAGAKGAGPSGTGPALGPIPGIDDLNLGGGDSGDLEKAASGLLEMFN